MFIERHIVTLAVNAAGALTTYTATPVSGRVLAIRYVPHATTPLDTAADLTITGEESGVAIATLVDIGTVAFTKAIRTPTHDVAGVALVYIAAGQAVTAPVVVAGERLKVVVAQGGVSMSGTLHIFVG